MYLKRPNIHPEGVNNTQFSLQYMLHWHDKQVKINKVNKNIQKYDVKSGRKNGNYHYDMYENLHFLV